MKKIFIAVLLFATVAGFAQKKQSLFNGKDLEGWTIWVNDPSVSPEKFFYVQDGVIETPGVPAGYLLTKNEYSNYRLHAEWCYPETPTNSGIFLHTNLEDKQRPHHYQCQLKHGFAGDFIVNAAGEQATVGDSIYIGTDKVKPIAAKNHPSNEKKAGEWNTLDITCKRNTVEIKVNGLLQNTAEKCSMTKGSIGLQAEGSRIQFRNIWIEEIK